MKINESKRKLANERNWWEWKQQEVTFSWHNRSSQSHFSLCGGGGVGLGSGGGGISGAFLAERFRFRSLLGKGGGPLPEGGIVGGFGGGIGLSRNRLCSSRSWPFSFSK